MQPAVKLQPLPTSDLQAVISNEATWRNIIQRSAGIIEILGLSTKQGSVPKGKPMIQLTRYELGTVLAGLGRAEIHPPNQVSALTPEDEAIIQQAVTGILDSQTPEDRIAWGNAALWRARQLRDRAEAANPQLQTGDWVRH